MQQLLLSQERLHAESSFLHSHLNHHAETFEVIESVISQSLSSIIRECSICFQNLFSDLPNYISEQIIFLTHLYPENNHDFVAQKLAKLSEVRNLILTCIATD